jgi:hypothetical protein
MALTYKKIGELTDMTSANINDTTKILATTGSTKVNNNLKVSDLIVDNLSTDNRYQALSAKQGKLLQDSKAPIASPTFIGTVGGITKAMVDLGNADNTSDANKPVSIAQAATLAPKANPVFTGVVYHGASEVSAPEYTDEDGYLVQLNGETVLTANVSRTDDHSSDFMEFGARNYGYSYFKGLNVDIKTGNVDGGNGTGTITLHAKYIAVDDVTLIPVYADNAAAASLPSGTIYRTSTGVLMIKY